MSESTNLIRDAVIGSLGYDNSVNPLASIGLSRHILEVGLSEDELYELVVKHYARALLVLFHPDRSGSVDPRIVAQQRNAAVAHEILKDRVRFGRFLKQFRLERSANRSSASELSIGLSDQINASQRLQSRLCQYEKELSLAQRELRESVRIAREASELRQVVMYLRRDLGNETLKRKELAKRVHDAYVSRRTRLDLRERNGLAARKAGRADLSAAKRQFNSNKSIFACKAKLEALNSLSVHIGYASDRLAAADGIAGILEIINGHRYVLSEQIRIEQAGSAVVDA